MSNLVEIRNNQVVVSSRQVAESFGKEHRNVKRDIERLIAETGMLKNEQTPEMFQKSTYIHEQNKQEYPMYLMNRDGFTLLVMGFTGKEALEWKVKYIEAFNTMEKQLQNQQALPNFNDPVASARAWADAMEAKQKAQLELEANKPKIEFAEAIQSSRDCISISTMASLLKQNGHNTGRDRLFKWLREKGYLIKDKRIDDYNKSTQKAKNLGVLEVNTTVINTQFGTRIHHTPLVTPKGQEYFLKNFKSA